MNDSARLVRGSARPTMKDVASRAGVALKTVSRVVNGEPGVTPQTTKRVLISPGLTVVSYDAAEAGRRLNCSCAGWRASGDHPAGWNSRPR